MNDVVWSLQGYFVSADEDGNFCMKSMLYKSDKQLVNLSKLNELVKVGGSRALMRTKEIMGEKWNQNEEFYRCITNPSVEQYFELDLGCILDNGQVFWPREKCTDQVDLMATIPLDKNSGERIVYCVADFIYGVCQHDPLFPDTIHLFDEQEWQVIIIIENFAKMLRCCVLLVDSERGIEIVNKRKYEDERTDTNLRRVQCGWSPIWFGYNDGILTLGDMSIEKVHHIYLDEYLVIGDPNSDGSYNMFKLVEPYSKFLKDANLQFVCKIFPISRHVTPTKSARK